MTPGLSEKEYQRAVCRMLGEHDFQDYTCTRCGKQIPADQVLTHMIKIQFDNAIGSLKTKLIEDLYGK